MASQITALPTPPSRNDPANFIVRADAFLTALPTFQSQANALANEAEANVLATANNVTAAQNQVALAANQVNLATGQVALAAGQVALAAGQVALASQEADRSGLGAQLSEGYANYRGEYSSAATYQVGQSVSFNGSFFTAKTVNTNVTPVDGANWIRRSATRGSLIISENTNAVANNLYVLTASLILTLPGSPLVGDFVVVSNQSGTLTPVIARNGLKIMGLNEDLTFNVLNAGVTLTYTGAQRGWVLV